MFDATIAISEELWLSSCPAPPCPAPPASALSVMYQMLLVMLNCNQGSSSTQSYAAPLSLSVLYVPRLCSSPAHEQMDVQQRKAEVDYCAGLQTGKASSGSSGLLAGTAALIVLLFAAMTIELPHLIS